MKNQENFFSRFPFGYAQNLVIISGLFFVGVLIEGIFRGSGFFIPSFPFNWICLSVQLLLGIFLYFLPFGKKVKEWMTSIPFVVITSLFLIFLVLLSGVVPQPEDEGYNLARYLGLTHIVRSWYFVIIFFLLSLSLELTMIKRWGFKSLKDFAFFFNHFGILVVIVASFWGSSDLRRVPLEIHPDELVWQGTDQKNRTVDLPFALKLKEFRIDEYQPQIVFIDRTTQKILSFKTVHHAEKNSSFIEHDWKIAVTDYQPYIWPLNGQIIVSKQYGAPSGALIEATQIKTGEVVKGWISTQSMMQDPQILSLSEKENISLAMIDGRPKRFSSDFTWYTPDGKQGEGKVEVNKPFALSGWKLYQYGYDEKMGRWSQMTIIEAVRDPWLPFVYLGMSLALLGTFLFIWTGRENES